MMGASGNANAAMMSMNNNMMMGPAEDLETLVDRSDHLGVLRYIRAHALREPSMVVSHGQAFLKEYPNHSTSSPMAVVRLAVLEQVCLASLEVPSASLTIVGSSSSTVTQYCLDQLNEAGIPTESARYRRLKGRVLEAEGDYDGAQTLYQSMLVDNPSNLFALQRQYALCKAQLHTSSSSSSSGSGADESSSKQKTIQMIQALNDYVGQQCQDVGAWYELAKVCKSVADFERAAYALEQVVLASPLDASLHCELAETYATHAAGFSSNPNKKAAVQDSLSLLTMARKHMAQALELDASHRRAQLGLISVAQQFLDVLDAASPSAIAASLDDAEQERQVAQALVTYGAAQVRLSYPKGNPNHKRFDVVLNDFLDNL